MSREGSAASTPTFTYREKTVREIAPTYSLGYFLGYNMIGSFLISLLIPVATLGTLNTLIWRKLTLIWKNRYAAYRSGGQSRCLFQKSIGEETLNVFQAKTGTP